MTTASRQAAFMYLHGRRNEEGAWMWSTGTGSNDIFRYS
jgi:hypothetical protein